MTTPDQSPESAMASLNKFFADNGIPTSLGAWAWDRLLNGASEQQIYLEMRDRPEYQARFPAIADLRKQGKGVSEAEYIATENSYRQTMHAYGLPKGFYDDPNDFATLMKGDVSPAELNSRVQTYSSVVLGDTETLNQLRTFYADQGIPRSAEGDLLAYYLDPNKAAPLLEQQVHAAQFGAAAAKSGFGQLTQAEAETFGARAGVDERTARVGFEELTRGKELFQALPGQAEQDISRDVQLGAVAFGGNALDTNEIRKRREQRVAQGQGAQSFAAGRAGASGLGSQQV